MLLCAHKSIHRSRLRATLRVRRGVARLCKLSALSLKIRVLYGRYPTLPRRLSQRDVHNKRPPEGGNCSFARGRSRYRILRRRASCNRLTQDPRWIANHKTIGWDIFGHNASRADGTVVTNANARKNYHVGANPHVILDQNRCGRRYLTLLEAILVPINDAQVMTEQTVAADSDFSVRGDRRAVVDEGVLAYRNMRTFMRHDFDRYNGAH